MVDTANSSGLSFCVATDPATSNDWPSMPGQWPDVMTEVQVCQYLHLDEGRSVATAKRSLRFIRSTQGLPDVGRIGGKVLFRRSSVDQWLEDREEKQ
ncbi:MAG: helix-turn-helix domain-containing protein [Planctomycetes bacterium]|nr:helix-turn-helix domain-containing protein [Planctomycetota bacterium]